MMTEEEHLERLQRMLAIGTPFLLDACERAAKWKHLSCLKFLHENSAEWGSCVYQASRIGFLEGLQYAHQNGAELCWHDFNIAQEEGHILCADYLHAHLTPKPPDNSLKYTANLGDLKAAHASGKEITEGTVSAALEARDAEAVTYLLAQRGYIDLRTCFEAAGSGNTFIFEYVGTGQGLGRTFPAALHNGQYEFLEMAEALGYRWGEYTCEGDAAACAQNMRYALGKGATIGQRSLSTALRHGHTDCIRRMVYEQYAALDQDHVSDAISGGNLECLDFVLNHTRGIPQIACSDAIGLGRADMLKRLIEKGAVITQDDCRYAFDIRKFEILQITHANCKEPWSVSFEHICIMFRHIDIILYCIEQNILFEPLEKFDAYYCNLGFLVCAVVHKLPGVDKVSKYIQTYIDARRLRGAVTIQRWWRRLRAAAVIKSWAKEVLYRPPREAGPSPRRGGPGYERCKRNFTAKV